MSSLELTLRWLATLPHHVRSVRIRRAVQYTSRTLTYRRSGRWTHDALRPIDVPGIGTGGGRMILGTFDWGRGRNAVGITR